MTTDIETDALQPDAEADFNAGGWFSPVSGSRQLVQIGRFEHESRQWQRHAAAVPAVSDLLGSGTARDPGEQNRQEQSWRRAQELLEKTAADHGRAYINTPRASRVRSIQHANRGLTCMTMYPLASTICSNS